MHTPSKANDAVTVIDALIDGLRISDRSLNDKCLAALRSVGGRVVPLLQAVANDQSTRTPHRRRLINAIELIKCSDTVDVCISVHVTAALFEALRVHNKRLNSKAMAAIQRFPGGLVNHLITEAVCNRKKTGYCVRLLAAAEQLRTPPDAMRHLDLFLLASLAKPELREAVGRLLCRIVESYRTPYLKAKSDQPTNANLVWPF